QYVIENHSVPGNQECWSCYHPPVYYVSAVPSYLLSEFLGMPGTTGLQTFSLLLSVLTTFFGLLFLRKILEGRNLVLASVLWIFWPLMIMVAPRIGNDQLFYLLHVLCLWAGISYFKDGRGKYLIVAVVATALALWTKTTGVVTLGMLFVLMVGGFFAKGELRKPTRSEVVSWSLFIVLIAAFVLQKLLGSDLVGNADYLNSSMKVQNEAFNYLYFDLRSFLEYPWTSCWNSMMGRNFFWNFALKTSLFGEWDMLPTAEGRLCATIMSVLLLGLVVYGIRGFWKKRLDFVHWILFLQGIAFFGSLATLRLKYPFACSNDFRYILPVLLSIVPFVANGVTLKESSTIWKVGGYVIVLAFVVSSAILYIMVM
ncbi:MAG: glycosyltransferase family 39 protein, partial [Fibrobacter sp.]|nr:glycosyltransferase family 39 protein [Fibrobacter sp.]